MRAASLITASVLALSTLGLSSVTPSAQADFPIPFPGGDIFGFVRQASTGLPVGEGVEVVLSRKGIVIDTGTTNKFGRVEFEELRPGGYTLSALGSTRTVSLGSFSAFVTILVK